MEAKFYTKVENSRKLAVICELCPHRCLIKDGQFGICLTRYNMGGTLVAESYMQKVTAGLDPIEKKPLFHHHPGENIYSIGPNGCSLRCTFCQNSRIAQESAPTSPFTIRSVLKAAEGTAGVAYTYAEPTTWIETLLNVAPMVKEAGLSNVLVTNGFVNPEPLKELLPYINAMNVDIKGFTEDYYQQICKGRLQPVLDTCVAAHLAGVHVEISFLLVAGQNDKDTKKLCAWIAACLGEYTPLHIQRCFPHHLMTGEPTPPNMVEKAYQQASKILKFVYAPGHQDTLCPRCGKVMVERHGYDIKVHSRHCCGTYRFGIPTTRETYK